MFLVIDTEDDSLGNLKLIVIHNGIDYFVFHTREPAIDYLISIEHRIKCFAVNLQYDMINLFGIEYLIKNCKLLFSKTSLLSTKFKKVSFIDTLNHWQLSVAKMGELIGLSKLEFDPDNVEYCKRDCEITHKYVSYMLKEYDNINLKLGLTIGSSALSFYYRDYCNIRRKVIPKNVLEYFKKFYFGGRSECFKLGYYEKAHCIDINSMYASCMKKVFPNPFEYICVTGIPKCKFYLVECIVKSNLELPILPKKFNNKLCFPNGVFHGYFTSVEIEYFLEKGGKILKIINVIYFPFALKPFENYVDIIYNRRLKSKNIFENLTYRLLLNSFYGKFGQGNESTSIIPIEKYIDEKEKYRGGKPILNNEYVITIEVSDYPKHTNFIWSLFITSYARIKLYKLIEFVKYKKKFDLLYCDTDSVIYIGDKLNGSDKLGDFKTEFYADNIYIKGIKEYYYNTDTETIFKVKGIPKNDVRLLKKYFDGEKIYIKKPVKLRQSLRYNKFYGKENVWLEHGKQSQSEYDKGIVIDNIVYPHVLNEIFSGHG